MDLLASDCMKLLDEFHVKHPVVVIGLAMGGYVTMAFYSKYPEIGKWMILTSTRPGPDSPEGKVNRDVSILNAHEHGACIIVDNMLPMLFSGVTLSTKPEIIKIILGVIPKHPSMELLAYCKG